ncbi:MAG: glycosyltransferase [Ferruginibacter sp.]|nr:glycosyltransferase [Cytophagales bacterium]
MDDGSIDKSLEVARRYENHGIRLFAQPNEGAASARNHALRQARGEYIQYLDADDALHPQKIEVQLRELAGESLETLASGVWGKFTTAADRNATVFLSHPVLPNREKTPKKYLSPAEWFVRSWSGGGSMQTGAWLTHRSLCEKAGAWNETLLQNPNDDGEYFCRVILASHRVKFCPDAKVYYRTFANAAVNRVSNPNGPVKVRSLYASLELCSGYLLAAEDSPGTRLAAANLFQEFAYGLYPAYPDLVAQAERRVEELGGSEMKFKYDPGAFKALASVVGWKAAKRLKHHLRRIFGK